MSGNKQNEEDCSCYAKSRTPASCDIRNVTHPLRYYEFTQDEIKVLEECDKESFYRRCVPFSTLFATITYAAIKYGSNCISILLVNFVLLIRNDWDDATKIFIEFLLTSMIFFFLGFLNRNPHFGVVPKVIMAAFLGHVYGRLTYLSTCDAKLRELPKNSHLGNVMRQYYLEHNPPPDPNKKR